MVFCGLDRKIELQKSFFKSLRSIFQKKFIVGPRRVFKFSGAGPAETKDWEPRGRGSVGQP